MEEPTVLPGTQHEATEVILFKIFITVCETRCPMVCSVCAETLVAGEVRDRDGTTFVIWQCRQLHEVLPGLKREDVHVWGKVRARLQSYWQKPVHC
jgi:hypothetical protein